MIPVFDVKSIRSRLSKVSSVVRLQRMRALSRILSVRSASSTSMEEQKSSSTVVVPIEFNVLFHNRHGEFPKSGLYNVNDGSTDVFEYLIERAKADGFKYFDRFVTDVYLSSDFVYGDDYQISENDGIPYRVEVIFDRDELEKNKEWYYDDNVMLTYVFGLADYQDVRTSTWEITDFAEVYTERDLRNRENNIEKETMYKEVIDKALEGS